MAEPFAVWAPDKPPGTLAITIPPDRAQEFKDLELDRKRRLWWVRAVVADHVPLVGSFAEVLESRFPTRIKVEGGGQTLYVHNGGSDATYFDLVGDHDEVFEYAQVQVEADLPADALLFSRGPFGHLLDVLCRWQPGLPAVIQRLELISPIDGGILAYEATVPFARGLVVGELGGAWRRPIFAMYDSISREATASSSPFYRLLCAFRIYEGVGRWVRPKMKAMCRTLKMEARLPKDPVVDHQILAKAGLTGERFSKIKRAQDLFEAYRSHKNGISHFLIGDGDDEGHVPVSDGETIHDFAAGSAVLLHYALTSVEDLRMFFEKHIGPSADLGSVLPLPENREQFVIRPRE